MDVTKRLETNLNEQLALKQRLKTLEAERDMLLKMQLGAPSRASRIKSGNLAAIDPAAAPAAGASSEAIAATSATLSGVVGGSSQDWHARAAARRGHRAVPSWGAAR